VDGLPTPGAFPQTYPIAALTNKFDRPYPDYTFGDTLAIAIPSGSTVDSARLIMRVAALDAQAYNDSIILHVPNTPPFANSMNAISGAWWQYPMKKILVFHLPNNFITGINIAVSKALDVVVQDDTSIDFLRLDVCYTKP
jgi:hypothetical protein